MKCLLSATSCTKKKRKTCTMIQRSNDDAQWCGCEMWAKGGGLGIKKSLKTVTPGDMKWLQSATRCTKRKRKYCTMTQRSNNDAQWCGCEIWGKGGLGIKISLRTVTAGEMKCLLSATRCTQKKKKTTKSRNCTMTQRSCYGRMWITLLQAVAMPYRVNCGRNPRRACFDTQFVSSCVKVLKAFLLNGQNQRCKNVPKT